MTDQMVHFKAIQLHRVLGIRQGEGFELSELSPSVNLVHGPNGSGKSTTALVIQELLWSGRTGLQRPTVAGGFLDGEIDWWVDVDAGHAETARNGESGIVSEFGPPENRHRYHLALHELISDDNSDFAKTIADASQGGYDLEAATRVLGFTERPSAPQKKSEQLKEARKTVDKLRSDQRNIEQHAAELTDLRKQRDEAGNAERNIDLLEKACAHKETEDKCQQLRLKLKALPEGVAKLLGDEREKLDQIAARRRQLEEELTAEQEKIERAQRELDEVKLPDEGVDREVLTRLRADQTRLSLVETDIRQKTREVTQADKEAQSTRCRISEHLSEEQLASIEVLEIGEMSTFARQSDRIRAQQRVIEERRRWLDQEEPEEVPETNTQQIREGITALGHWLSSPTPAARLWWPILAAAVLITLLGVVLAFVHHWVWVLAVLAAAGVAMWHWWLRQSTAATGTAESRTVHRQSYEAIGLQPPDAWEVPVVSELVRHLVRLAAVRAHEDERIRRMKGLQADANALDQQRSELDRQRERLIDRLGLSIDIGDEWLPLLVDNISSWQKSSTEAAGVRQVLMELNKEKKTLLDRINVILRPFGYNGIDSAESASQWIEDLAERRSRHRNATSQLSDGKRRIEETIEPSLRTEDSERIESSIGSDSTNPRSQSSTTG